MKKLTLALFFLTCTLGTLHAQEIGIRAGAASGGYYAVDGVFSTGEFNRIHADLSFSGYGVGIDALWDFVYRPLDIEGVKFNWYAGAGAFTYIGDPFLLGVAGEVGIEYRFKEVPIVLGLDWRPAFSIITRTDLFLQGFGFNARWAF